jgi:hypothetical protein
MSATFEIDALGVRKHAHPFDRRVDYDGGVPRLPPPSDTRASP